MRLFKRLKLALITAAVSVGAPGALSVNVNDGVGVAEDVAPQIQVYEVSVNDDIGVAEDITPQIPTAMLDINVADAVSITESAAIAAWLNIDSSHINSVCGEDGASTLAVALDGTNYWKHHVNENHYFIIYLGASYTVEKVRGRSISPNDPNDIDIYVSADTINWGVAVATNITTWRNNSSWVEIDTTDKEGRYVKVDILDTESGVRNLDFGVNKIFDVYVSAPTTLAVDTNDGIGVDEDVSFQIKIYEVSVSDDVGITESIVPQIKILEIDVNDGVGLVDAVTVIIQVLEVNTYDSIGITDTSSLEIPILEIFVNDGVGVITNITPLFNLLLIDVVDTLGVTEDTAVVVLGAFEVNDSLGVTEDITIELTLEVNVSDSIGVTDYSLIQIQILEIYTDDDIGLTDWRLHNIPGVSPILTKDLFRFPRLPDDASDELRIFLTDLESSLRTVLTGDSYVGGVINADGCKVGDLANYIKIDDNGVLTLHGRAAITDLVLSGFTQGSVLFAGAGGVVSEDNDGIFWNDATKRFGVAGKTGDDVYIFQDAGNGIRIRSDSLTTQWWAQDDGPAHFGTVSNDDLHIRTNNNSRITIKSGVGNGYVGINESDPHSRLDVNGAISSATLTVTTSSDTLDVSGVNTVFINIAADIILGGLVGGVNGQVINFAIIGNFVNHCRFEHQEGIGGDTQDFINHLSVDEDVDHGGCIYVCNGTNWYDISHARHV